MESQLECYRGIHEREKLCNPPITTPNLSNNTLKLLLLVEDICWLSQCWWQMLLQQRLVVKHKIQCVARYSSLPTISHIYLYIFVFYLHSYLLHSPTHPHSSTFRVASSCGWKGRGDDVGWCISTSDPSGNSTPLCWAPPWPTLLFFRHGRTEPHPNYCTAIYE